MDFYFFLKFEIFFYLFILTGVFNPTVAFLGETHMLLQKIKIKIKIHSVELN